MPADEDIEKLAAGSGFTLQRTHLLRPFYAKTLDIWAANRVRRLRPARYHQPSSNSPGSSERGPDPIRDLPSFVSQLP